MLAYVSLTKCFKSIITYKRTFYIFDENVKSFNLISRYLFTNAVNQVPEEKIRGPLLEYERRIAAGRLENGDASQVGTLRELQRLYEELVENSDACNLDQNALTAKAKKRWFWSHFKRQASYNSPVKGLYIYGGVGTGKTMLMDLFFDQLPSNWRKQRIHFHDFMLNVHSSLQRHRKLEDPIEAVSSEICKCSILLCLDEFMVPDIAVAFILSRLFEHLFSNGVILVTTSNRAPENLYQGGLQRDLFQPFVATLKERCLVHEIASPIDYRRLSSTRESLYIVGNDLSASLLKQKFKLLIGDNIAGRQEIDVVMGRKLQVPLGSDGCAYFTFEELCDRPYGAADYSALFNNFHSLALEGVPIFGLHNRPAAYRFVTMVDVMYDNKAILLCTAEGNPVELFQRIVTVSQAQNWNNNDSNLFSDLCVDNKLAFAKDRTISRLTEMNSRKYLDQHTAMLTSKRNAT